MGNDNSVGNDNPQTFAGDKKHGQSILGPAERKLIDFCVPKLPQWLRSWQLTMTTLLWSTLTVLFGWLADGQRGWLFAMSVVVFGQWVTDSFDGTLGRTRGEGLVKWGFFMDHFLDLLFAGSIVIGYSFIAPEGAAFLFYLLLLVTCAMMAVSFLSFAATNQFQIAYYGLGPTEIRIGYIALNTFVFFVGESVFWWGVPVILALNVFALTILVWQTHKNLWAIDKAALAATQGGPTPT